MRQGLLTLLLAALALQFFAGKAAAQSVTWEKIGQIGLGIQCGYFWNRGEGVIATGAAQFYYLKGGQVWKAGLKLPIPSTVNSIRCFDGKTLYATVQNVKVACQVWKSIDSGVTWTLLPPQNGDFLGGSDNGPDVYWSYLSNSLAFKGSTDVRLDSLDILSTIDDGESAPPYTSRDGGRTWGRGTITGPPYLSYNYLSGIGACVDLKNKIYYASADNGAPGMFRSTDSGRSWTTLSSLPQNLYMMDDVEGIYDKTFIQTSKGLYETTDSGNTWKWIGGPARATSDDARFFVFGCSGQTVVAFGDDGTIWIANGWDAPDQAGLHSSFSASPAECDSGTIVVNVDLNFEPGRLHIQIENDSTGAFTLLSPDTMTLTAFGWNQIVISFKGTDLAKHSALLSITSLDYGACPVTHPLYGQAHLLPPQIKPPKPILACAALSSQFRVTNPNCEHLHILNDSSYSPDLTLLALDSIIADTGWIPFTCRMLAQQGAKTYVVHISGRFEPSNTPFDTTTSVTVNYNYTPSTIISSLTFCDLGTSNACLSKDTSFVLQNTGCDTLRVALSQISLGNGWTLTPSFDTIQVLPDSFYTVFVHFSTPITGLHDQQLTYNYFGRDSGTVSIDLNATVAATQSAVLLSDTAIDLGTTTICGNDTTLDITFTTQGCDSTFFSNFHLDAGNSFQLLNGDDTVILPNGLFHKQIFYHPTQDGPSVQRLTVHISQTDGSLAHDTSIAFSVKVTGHRTILRSFTNSIDVGKTYICEERDTSVVIQNIGCDTVCLTSVSATPSCFVVTSASSLCVAPGEYDTILLHTQIDTSGGAIANKSLLTITSKSQPPISPIALSREIIDPSPWSLSLSAPDSCYPGENIAYKILQKGQLAADVNGVDMQLTFNDDMLQLNAIDEPSVTQKGFYRDALGTAHYLLHFAPPTTDSILATLHLFTYQTRVASTPIALDSIHLNSNIDIPEACITTLSLDSTAFTMRYRCESQLISESLNGEELIFSIAPNPAMEIALLRYSSTFIAPVNTSVSIEDELGRIISSKQELLIPGKGNSLPLDLTSIPSGVYCIRIAFPGEAKTARLVKE